MKFVSLTFGVLLAAVIVASLLWDGWCIVNGWPSITDEVRQVPVLRSILGVASGLLVFLHFAVPCPGPVMPVSGCSGCLGCDPGKMVDAESWRRPENRG